MAKKKNLEMASKVSCGNLVSVLAQNLYWTKNLGSKRVLSVDQLSSPESALPRLPLMKLYLPVHLFKCVFPPLTSEVPHDITRGKIHAARSDRLQSADLKAVVTEGIVMK